MDLSVDTMYLKDAMVHFAFEGSTLFLSLFLLSPIISMLCYCTSTVRKDYFSENLYGLK